MATQAINIELPDDIYRRLEEAAAATQQPLEEVLFQTIRGNLPPVLADLAPEQREIVADLQHMDSDSLWAIAREALPKQSWQRHQRLLHKGEQGTLTPDEQAELASLREATDRLVTRRSYALALLKWRGYAIPSTL